MTIKDFEKRDLVEIVEEFGVSLTYHESDRPYYTAFCPFHHNVKTPAFAVMPAIQRWYCYTCKPEGGDAIDFFRIQGYSFEEAKQKATLLLEPEEALIRQIQRTSLREPEDWAYLQQRLCAMTRKPCTLPVSDMLRVMAEFDILRQSEDMIAADKLLRKYNY